MTFTNPTFIIFFGVFLLAAALSSYRSSSFVKCLIVFNFIFYAFNGINDVIYLMLDLVFVFLASYYAKRIIEKRLSTYILAIKFILFIIFKIVQTKSEAQTALAGYSFYFLTSTAYLIDTYRRQVSPLGAKEFFAAATYFPTIVSGPVNKISEIGAQLTQESRQLKIENIFTGFLQLSVGLFKKSLADLTFNIVVGNQIADSAAPTTMAWIKTIAFAAKYYADFSGYSDIAIGISRMLGIKINENFRTPFFASSFSDFWRRWHMSFNIWLKEYVFDYICFGDYSIYLEKFRRISFINFIHKNRIYLAIVSTGIFAGLWHGFTIMFLCWGLYVGVVLSLEFALKNILPKNAIFRHALTYILILNSFLFFRFTVFKLYAREFVRLYSFGHSEDLTACTIYFLAAAVVTIIPHLIDYNLLRQKYFEKKPIVAIGLAILILSAYYLLSDFSGANFVYSRF